MRIETFKKQTQAFFDMCKDTCHSRQLRTWPLTMIKPDIGKTTNIRHNCQTEVDDEATNSARNKLLLQVCQRCKKIVQFTATKIIEHPNQPDACYRSYIANELGHEETM